MTSEKKIDTKDNFIRLQYGQYIRIASIDYIELYKMGKQEKAKMKIFLAGSHEKGPYTIVDEIIIEALIERLGNSELKKDFDRINKMS